MARFDDIISDNRSGSGSILKNCQQALLHLAREKEPVSADFVFKKMDALLQNFPYFGLLYHFHEALKTHFSEERLTSQNLVEFISSYERQWKSAQDESSRHVIEKVDFEAKRVLLHSNSSALQNLFGQVRDKAPHCELFQTFSSPAGEGQNQAEALSKLGFRVTMIHEDAIGKFIDNIDFGLFGSDLLLDDAFINKTGTFPLALMLNHFHKPVYVITERRKVRSTGASDIVDKITNETPKPFREIYQGKLQEIDAVNHYFELIPLSLVNEVFLD
ncbi:MAG: hypothetical protein P8100_01130 [bacterium]